MNGPDSINSTYQYPQGEQNATPIENSANANMQLDAHRDIERALAHSASLDPTMRLERPEQSRPLEPLYIQGKIQKIRALRVMGVSEGRWHGQD